MEVIYTVARLRNNAGAVKTFFFFMETCSGHIYGKYQVMIDNEEVVTALSEQYQSYNKKKGGGGLEKIKIKKK